MKKILICLALMMLLIVPSVLALNTDINVRTLKNHKVFVSVQDPETNVLLDSSNAETGSTGGASFSLETGGEDYINIIVKVTLNGEKVMLEKFEEQINGEAAYLQVISGVISEDYRILDAELAAEEEAAKAEELAALNATNETEEEPDTGEPLGLSGILGFAVKIKDTVLSKKGYYVMGIVVLLGFLIFVVRPVLRVAGKLIPKGRASASSSSPETKVGSDVDADNLIEDAQRKIKEAQEEIALLRNKDRIKKAKRQLEEDQKRLEKLMSGEEPDSE